MEALQGLARGNWVCDRTAAAEAGLLDVHDCRPVVLAPEDAQLWLDPDLPAEQAEHLARNMSLGPEDFE